MDDLTSEELMTLHQSNAHGAFDKLYDRHHAGVEGRIVRMLSTYTPELVHHTPDLVQEVFTYLHVNKECFIPGSRFNSWLSTVVKHIVLNHVRAERRECRDRRQTMPLSLNPKFALAIPDPLEKKRADAAILESRIEEGIEVLPAEHQEAVRLVFFDGLTAQQAADKMGVPLSTLNWWRREALAKMRWAMTRTRAPA